MTTLLDVDLEEGHCSLREALVAADTDEACRDCPAGSGADEIELTLDGAVTLAADLPAVEDAVTVRGRGVGR